jgi:hypothetical protein
MAKKSFFIQINQENITRKPNDIVSAYKDNVAFVKGPRVNNLHQKLTKLIL